ncbi:S8 family serine peptidase [Anaerovorax odorimutans]|uniref:S8 family serine peptidase n=2 Tax=Anaerovorax odorimutans TaxID=109327 RepID=A0ABT1RRV3_9FIRM|nr:S8 family serine peptidase [Anaerovorax odorimutans]
MKKLHNRTLSILVILCLLVSVSFAGLEGTAVYGAEKQSEAISGDYAEDQLIVVFEDDVSKKEAAKIVDKKDGEDLTVLETPQDEVTAVVELPKAQSVEEAVTAYEKDSNVAYAQPNYRYSLIDEEEPATKSGSAARTKAATADLNDPGASKLWHLDKIGVEEAWNLLDGVNHQKTRVAVLDTGVDTNHPDLQMNLNKSLCKDTSYGYERALNGDDDGHGTHVAGIIAATASNEVGTAGVASGKNDNCVDLFVVDVFQGEDAYSSGIIAGLQYASRNQAKVVNMSLGYANGGALNWEDKLLEDAVDHVVSQGTTVVCAAGNDNNQVPNYPADFESCISVISTNKSNLKSNFSNYGSKKDISAPGGETVERGGKTYLKEGIYSTYPNNSYEELPGTSMASPVVAGVTALLYYAEPQLGAEQVKKILYTTANDIYSTGYDIYSGYGIVNAENAVQALLKNENILKLSLNMNNASVKQGAHLQLTASVLLGNKTKALSWSSSNPSVAGVSSTGMVTAYKAGRTMITVTANDSLGVSATCQVTVPYTISYNLNGGKNSAANPSTYYGSTVNLKNPTRKGYTFAGWYTSSSYRTKVTSISSGNYTLYAKWNKVSVKKASIKSLKRVSKTKLKVTYKKISGAKGYQITYSTSKKFSKKKTKSVTTSSTKKTLKKLKKGKTYYVKVRAYKKDSTGAKVYGKYSKVKKIKLKK